MHEIWKKLKEYNYPYKCGLNYENELTFLIAILLSAQANDNFINSQTQTLFAIAKTAQDYIDLGIDGIAHYIQRIGLWRNKSKNIFLLAQKVVQLIEINNSGNSRSWYQEFYEKKYELDDLTLYSEPISKEGIPSFRAGLMELNGIGRKGANVFLNIYYKAITFPVDTHVKRLANRIGFVATENVFEIERTLQECVPKDFAQTASCELVWHGRNVCMAKNPQCAECKLKFYCNFGKKKLNLEGGEF